MNPLLSLYLQTLPIPLIYHSRALLCLLGDFHAIFPFSNFYLLLPPFFLLCLLSPAASLATASRLGLVKGGVSCGGDMEEEFKKREDGDCVGERSVANVEYGGMEGVGDVLEGVVVVMKTRSEEEGVLEDVIEEVVMESVLSWESVKGGKEGMFLETILDECMVKESLEGVDIVGMVYDEVGIGEEGEILVENGWKMGISQQERGGMQRRLRGV